VTLKSSAHIEYSVIRNHWQKLSRCRPGNHHWNPILRLTLKTWTHKDYCRIKIIDENCVVVDPEIITRTEFYGWPWNLQIT
jgi:hypothetical protein